MGTRGLYGFRKNGVDKTSYNHFDSYPDYLGRNVVRFCIDTSEDEMNEIYDRITMVDERDKPTKKQIEFCENNNLVNTSVSSGQKEDWYCLLREIQGDMSRLRDIVKENGNAYMIDNHTFILDSLFCEYAYIINLDTHNLEFYIGYQSEPCEYNRYGCEQEKDGYYPCKLYLEIPLNTIKDDDTIVDLMNLYE